ncbi:MAG: hypothetical protein M3N28_10755 [Actinomycetota bacterium]|nr:hypothetical protein [Actinomycetota bacterium]
MRRTLAVLVLIGLSVAASPAASHSCAAPVQVPVGEQASVTGGGGGRGLALTGIDV